MFDWQKVSEIWEQLAKEWETTIPDYGNYVKSHLDCMGLCASLSRYPYDKEVKYMYRVLDALTNSEVLYKWPRTVEGAKSRKDFCLIQAKKSKERVGTQVSEAWKIIGDSWKATIIYNDGTISNRQGYSGLCTSISALYWDGFITQTGREIMMEELYLLPHFQRNEFYWPRDEYGAEKRRKFCYLRERLA